MPWAGRARRGGAGGQPEQLAAAGLSRAKSSAIVDLASKVVSGEVQLERIGRLGDEEIIDHLVAVRGIGRWTAQMFLLGTLGRPDVWPTGDYGVRAGFALAFGHHELPHQRSSRHWASPSAPTAPPSPGTAGAPSTPRPS